MYYEKNAMHCGSLTKPRPGRLLDPDPMQAENADSAGLTRFPIQPPTFARSAGLASVPGLPRSVRVLIMRRRQTFEKRECLPPTHN